MNLPFGVYWSSLSILGFNTVETAVIRYRDSRRLSNYLGSPISCKQASETIQIVDDTSSYLTSNMHIHCHVAIAEVMYFFFHFLAFFVLLFACDISGALDDVVY